MQPKQKVNSLIELTRFIMALSVLFFHSYIPGKPIVFDVGSWCVSVDFFFVLGGFLLFNSLKNFKDLPLALALALYLKRKLSSMGIILLSGFFCAISFCLYLSILHHDITYMAYSVGYLWFILVEILGSILLLLLSRLIPNKKVLISLLISVFIIFYAYFIAFPPPYTRSSSNGYLILFTRAYEPIGYVLRGIGSMAIGYVIAFIPKLVNKGLKYTLGIIFFVVVIGLVIAPYFAYKEIILLLLYLPFVYFVFQVPLHFSLFNYLGSLAFGIYIFQTWATILAYYRFPAILTLIFIFLISIVSMPIALKKLFQDVKDRNFLSFGTNFHE